MIKKLKAFTLVELIVVMIISIITLATGYAIYSLVQRQFERRYSKDKTLQKYLLFQRALKNDFSRADKITANAEAGYVCFFFQGDSVLYFFDKNTVSRNWKENSELFDITVKKVETKSETVPGLLETISIDLQLVTDSTSINLKKEYSASEKILVEDAQ